MAGCSFDSDNCGTGLVGGSIPNPGDPDNFGTISARGIHGGIRVMWGYPLFNAHGVAHIRVLRGTNSFVDQATEIATTNSNYYEDMFGVEVRTYYYWIQYVSVQGTEYEPIGPAWATSFSTTEGYIEALHQRINEGVLAQALQTKIDRIQLNKLGIDQEMIDRAANDDALGVKYDEVKAFSDNSWAAIQEETLARTGADEAFASQVTTLYADLEGNIAAVQSEQIARVTADESLAADITTVESALGDQIAQAEQTLETKINVLDGTVQSIYTVKLSAGGLIGGFGLVNNSKEIEAGFDVDTFWIGRSTNKYKPFIVDSRGLYLNGRVEFTNLDGGSELKNKIDGWTKPGTTSINGNQIHTGDAYVDTLQIRGQAVTVPEVASFPWRTARGTDSWQEVGSCWVDPRGGKVVINACCVAECYISTSLSGSPATARYQLYARIRNASTGVVLTQADKCFTGEQVEWNQRAKVSGSHLVSLSAAGSPHYGGQKYVLDIMMRRVKGAGPNSFHSSYVTLVGLGCKR